MLQPTEALLPAGRFLSRDASFGARTDGLAPKVEPKLTVYTVVKTNRNVSVGESIVYAVDAEIEK